MAKIIRKGRYVTEIEYEESDPIYSEGWTIGPVIRPRQTEEEKQPTTLAESMYAMNWHEVGVTLRLEPDSAKQEFLASFRKGQNGEELPEGAEQYAQYMRSLHKGQQ
jgi:hypothetical protein